MKQLQTFAKKDLRVAQACPCNSLLVTPHPCASPLLTVEGENSCKESLGKPFSRHSGLLPAASCVTAFGASTPLMHPPLRCIHYLASSSTKPSTAVGYYAHCAFPLSLIAEGRLHGIRPLRPTFLLLWALAAFCMELLACSPCPPWAPLDSW